MDQTALHQGLHCLPIHLHILDLLFYDKTCMKFRIMTDIFRVSEFFRFFVDISLVCLICSTR